MCIASVSVIAHGFFVACPEPVINKQVVAVLAGQATFCPHWD
jgi:hypothetical protein